jgi:CPA2 family monovalent cation:H+ antiporter-2
MAAALLELGVMFAAVAVVGALAARLRQSVIPFYILAGVALGPFVAGPLTDEYLGRELAVGASAEATHFVELGAELGIVFLLFFLGLEFNLDRLLESRDRISAAGTADLVVNFGVGLVLGFALFGSVLPAIVVAGMVYISSSAVITKSLIDLGWIANPESEAILGTLVYEDLFIAVYLAVVTAVVAGGGRIQEAAVSVGIAVVFLLALVGLVHWGTATLERVLATNSTEFIILRVTGLTVLVGGAALALGVSEAVAAFFVGMAVSGTDQVGTVESLLEPVRDVFAAVFFFWIGSVTDPSTLPAVALPVLVAVALTTPAKVLSGFWSGKRYGLSDRRSTRVGLALVTRGEFTLIIAAVVLASAGGATGAIPGDLARTLNAFGVGYVLVMSVIGTTLMAHADAIERRIARLRARGTDDSSL